MAKYDIRWHMNYMVYWLEMLAFITGENIKPSYGGDD